MDFMQMLKAGFSGFAVSVGVQLLVFYLVGRLLGVERSRFIRVFILAAVASFLAVDLLLYYKIRIDPVAEPQVFLAGCLGGWTAGIAAGLTQMRGLLLGSLK